MKHEIGIRWTIGDVNVRGFKALRLSVLGMQNIFGEKARYAVCVNTIPADMARKLTGYIPNIDWIQNDDLVPDYIKDRLDPNMAEGVGWKFAPLRLFPDIFELSLDNDCIIWELPEALKIWLEDSDTRTCVFAEDIKACFGSFREYCNPQPRNSGIRGIPPNFDFEKNIKRMLAINKRPLKSELDEQGLQNAAISMETEPLIVSKEEVSICSPFYPHQQYLGTKGAHFVGLNTKKLDWKYFDKPALECIAEHWDNMRPELYERIMDGAAFANKRIGNYYSA